MFQLDENAPYIIASYSVAALLLLVFFLYVFMSCRSIVRSYKTKSFPKKKSDS